MKKLFTPFFVLIVLAYGLKAQTITIEPASHNLHFLASEQSDALSYVTNHTSGTRTIRWVRISDETSSTWTSTVCDENNCYSNSTYTKEFILDGGEDGLLKLTVTPNNMPGEGFYQILVYDINDSANANAVMDINVVAEAATGISDPIDGDVSIYPIPAKDVLNVNLEFVKNATSVEIFNVVGQKLKSVAVQDGSKVTIIPVSDLKKGVYFVRVYSNGQNVITKTFTKE